MEIDDCEHLNIEEDECLDCGLILKGQFNFRSDFSDTHPSTGGIAKTEIIDTLDLPAEVKNRMREIGFRNDKKNIFSCIYISFLDLQNEYAKKKPDDPGYHPGKYDYFNPDKYTKALGLKRKEINNCISEISGLSLKSKGYTE